MKIELTLTDDVYRYIEFIPKEQLSEILSGLLVEAIKNKSEKAPIDNTNTMSKVMAMIEQAVNNKSDNDNEQVKKETKKKVVEQVSKKKVITLDTVNNDIDDDFLEMLK